MQNTEYLKLPLYQDSEAPDISSSGHYNAAMQILDTKGAELSEDIADEREARIAGDSALEEKLAAETAAREAADTALEGKVATKADATDVTALGKRVDNAEVEISANSADLTGIKGLTYGTGGQVFLEEENGEYSSPALEEIQHEISDLQNKPDGTKVNSIAPLQLQQDWQAAVTTTNYGIAFGAEANCKATYGAAIGANAQTSESAKKATALGYQAMGTTENCVALGAHSECYEPNVVSVGSGNDYYKPKTRKITFVTDPVNAQDAATKNYVDTAIAGVSGGGGSGITVISVTEGNEAADVYAKVKATWPNCVTKAANYMYPAQQLPDGAYLFSTVAAAIMYVCAVYPTEIQTAYTDIVLPDATFGDLASGMHG